MAKRRIKGDDGIYELKMFGGLVFLVNGNMFVGVVGNDLMVRLGKAGADAALRRAHVREMDSTGRPMKTMVYVEAEGFRGDALDDLVTVAASFALGPPSERAEPRLLPIPPRNRRWGCGPPMCSISQSQSDAPGFWKSAS